MSACRGTRARVNVRYGVSGCLSTLTFVEGSTRWGAVRVEVLPSKGALNRDSPSFLRRDQHVYFNDGVLKGTKVCLRQGLMWMRPGAWPVPQLIAKQLLFYGS